MRIIVTVLAVAALTARAEAESPGRLDLAVATALDALLACEDRNQRKPAHERLAICIGNIEHLPTETLTHVLYGYVRAYAGALASLDYSYEKITGGDPPEPTEHGLTINGRLRLNGYLRGEAEVRRDPAR